MHCLCIPFPFPSKNPVSSLYKLALFNDFQGDCLGGWIDTSQSLVKINDYASILCTVMVTAQVNHLCDQAKRPFLLVAAQ